jgi:hypothetical protein
MEVSGQLHAPATLPPGKESLVPIGWEAGWATEPVRTLVKRKISSPYRDSNPPDHPARSLALYHWAIPVPAPKLNEVLPVIQGVGHDDTTFWQHVIILPRTVNVVLDVLLDCLVTVSCKIDFQSALRVSWPGHHVHRTWIPVIISFGARKAIVFTARTRTPCRSCKGNWKCCLTDRRWHVAWHRWQLCGSLPRPRGRKTSYWTRVHMKTTCTKINLYEKWGYSFMYHMLLYRRKLWI